MRSDNPALIAAAALFENSGCREEVQQSMVDFMQIVFEKGHVRAVLELGAMGDNLSRPAVPLGTGGTKNESVVWLIPSKQVKEFTGQFLAPDVLEPEDAFYPNSLRCAHAVLARTGDPLTYRSPGYEAADAFRERLIEDYFKANQFKSLDERQALSSFYLDPEGGEFVVRQVIFSRGPANPALESVDRARFSADGVRLS